MACRSHVNLKQNVLMQSLANAKLPLEAHKIATEFESIVDFYMLERQLEYLEISKDLLELLWQMDVSIYTVADDAVVNYRDVSVFVVPGEFSCNLALNTGESHPARQNYLPRKYCYPFQTGRPDKPVEVVKRTQVEANVSQLV